jgi:uncharacterized membrane protein
LPTRRHLFDAALATSPWTTTEAYLSMKTTLVWPCLGAWLLLLVAVRLLLRAPGGG